MKGHIIVNSKWIAKQCFIWVGAAINSMLSGLQNSVTIDYLNDRIIVDTISSQHQGMTLVLDKIS